MIELSDPYWRRLFTRSGLAAIVIAAAAFAAFPTAESGHGAPPPASSSEFNVSHVNWDYYAGMDNARLWVTVTNRGPVAAENLTANLEGIAPAANGPDQTDTQTGNLGRGGSTTLPVIVYNGASTTITVQISNFAPLARLSLVVTSPNGGSFPGQASGSGATVTITPDDAAKGGAGEWPATLTESGGVRGVSYRLDSVSSFPSASPALTLDELGPGQAYDFTWVVAAAPPPQVIPDNTSVTVDATVFDAQGRGARVSYRSTWQGAEAGAPVPEGGAAGGEAFLTAGEFLGFSAIAIVGLSVATGAVRMNGGRGDSQNRSRPVVSWHRVAWLSVLVVLLFHGLAQLAGGHLYLGPALLGTAAFLLLAGLIWFNAYQRPRVLKMEWPKWLRLKVTWAAFAIALIAAHVLVYGRHFAG